MLARRVIPSVAPVMSSALSGTALSVAVITASRACGFRVISPMTPTAAIASGNSENSTWKEIAAAICWQ
jgi:hypothetical protein